MKKSIIGCVLLGTVLTMVGCSNESGSQDVVSEETVEETTESVKEKTEQEDKAEQKEQEKKEEQEKVEQEEQEKKKAEQKKKDKEKNSFGFTASDGYTKHQKELLTTYTQLEVEERLGKKLKLGDLSDWNYSKGMSESGEDRWSIVKLNDPMGRVKTFYDWDGNPDHDATLKYFEVGGEVILDNRDKQKNNSNLSEDNELTEEASSTENNTDYQSILDDYTAKIQAAAPLLVDEYNNEAPANEDGLEGLAEISNDKVSKLAEISNEGISEMAEVMMTKGSGKYEEYEEWADKLMEVYMTEAEQITEAYMNSSM